MSKSASKRPRSDQLAPAWRAILSLLLIGHLLAVFFPPLTLQTSSRGSVSPLASGGFELMRPYIDAASLNHGYAFFAPDPGPSHLVRYRLEFDDGRQPLEQTFPDLERHWPRLLYHRHFMLSEQLHSDFIPPDPPPGLGPQEHSQWQTQRQAYRAKWRSYEQHLLAKYGAKRITMVRVEHLLPPPIGFIENNLQLDDPQSYIDLPEGPEIGDLQ